MGMIFRKRCGLRGLLMKEFFKVVAASLNGKTVKKSQGEIVAHQMVKNEINKGPVAMNLLLKFNEARQARREELLLKKQAEGSGDLQATAGPQRHFSLVKVSLWTQFQPR